MIVNFLLFFVNLLHHYHSLPYFRQFPKTRLVCVSIADYIMYMMFSFFFSLFLSLFHGIHAKYYRYNIINVWYIKANYRCTIHKSTNHHFNIDVMQMFHLSFFLSLFSNINSYRLFIDNTIFLLPLCFFVLRFTIYQCCNQI